jgi:hypothetical protein
MNSHGTVSIFHTVPLFLENFLRFVLISEDSLNKSNLFG